MSTKRLEADPDQLRLGPPAVMHAVADHVVDSYRWVTAAMEADVDAIEETTFSRPARPTSSRSICSKRRWWSCAGGVSAHRRPGWLNTAAMTCWSKVRRQMRDVLDHQILAADKIADEYDEMLSSLVQAALAKSACSRTRTLKSRRWPPWPRSPPRSPASTGMNFEGYARTQSWTWGYRRCCSDGHDLYRSCTGRSAVTTGSDSPSVPGMRGAAGSGRPRRHRTRPLPHRLGTFESHPGCPRLG